MLRWFAALISLTLAIMLHSFYVDYEVKYGFRSNPYLISWPATSLQREAVIDQVARSLMRPRRERVDFSAVGVWHGLREEHIRRYCSATERYRRLDTLDKPWRDPNDSVFFRCSRVFDIPKPEPKTIVTPAVSYATARAHAEKNYASERIYFGMVPSFAVAGDAPSRTAFVKTYWLGAIVPTALLALSVFLFFMGIRGRKGDIHPLASRSQPQVLAVQHSFDAGDARSMPVEAGSAESTSRGKATLADLLRSDLGEHFPVSGGNGKVDSPLVITDARDYVAVEYAVVRHVLTAIGEEYKLSKQSLLNRDDKKIDELVFHVKKAGAADWEGLRHFYFDVTAGFDAL